MAGIQFGFSPTDTYTASGAAKLYGKWTETVVKYTPSSFYNYEQDNLPLFDLEERTFLNWERNGYPTSSIPGMILTVSGSPRPDNTGSSEKMGDQQLCNPNLFTSVSAAVEALPEVISFPVTIGTAP